MIYRGVAITGTDTGAGKTAVACGLAMLLAGSGIRLGALKPVETGCEGEELAPADGLALAAAAGLEIGSGQLNPSQVSLDDVVPWRFRAPLAPVEAARLEGVEIGVDRIYQAMDRWMERADLVIVETAGGLLVPINPRFTMADLILGLELPVIVAAQNRLGVINHVMLTLEALHHRNLTPVAVVISLLTPVPDSSTASNARLLRSAAGLPVYEVPYDSAHPAAAATAALRPGLDDIRAALEADWKSTEARHAAGGKNRRI